MYLTNFKYTWLHPRPALALQRLLHNKDAQPEIDDTQYRHYTSQFANDDRRDESDEKLEELRTEAEARVHHCTAAASCSSLGSVQCMLCFACARHRVFLVQTRPHRAFRILTPAMSLLYRRLRRHAAGNGDQERRGWYPAQRGR